MTGDTFDRFQPRERGLFGDNEHASPRGRVSGSADIVDRKLIFICESQSGKAIGCHEIGAAAGPVIYLPKSQIEWEPRDPKNGDTIEVTLPGWLAREKGLT